MIKVSALETAAADEELVDETLCSKEADLEDHDEDEVCLHLGTEMWDRYDEESDDEDAVNLQGGTDMRGPLR